MDEQELKNARIKRMRKLIYELIPATLALYGIAGTLYFVFRSDVALEMNKIVLFLFAGMGVVGIFLVMNNYLQKAKSELKEKDFSEQDKDFDLRRIVDKLEYRNYEIQERLDKGFSILSQKIEDQLKKESSINLDERQKQEIYQTVLTSISTNLTKEFFESLKENVKGQIIEDKREQIFSLIKRGETSLHRLRTEIELLSRRANINLIIGSIITVGALILLGYFVVKENFNSDNILQVTLHFIPRLSLVVFIELFSFFFLKLYRASLQEIKYYQNELTNLELKQTAIITATSYGNEADISGIIKDLSATERNFKLLKGESTVELEKNKIETQSLKEILKSSIGALGKTK